MSTENGSSGNGVTFLEALTILFIGLKLAGVIDWPWWLVLSPILVPLGIAAIFFIVIGLALLVGAFCDLIVEVKNEIEMRKFSESNDGRRK